MDEQRLWEMEHRLWLDGAPVYEKAMDPECLMVFPGMGVMGAEAIVQSLRNAPRWEKVHMENRTLSNPVATISVLAYKAHGEREGDDTYSCLCTSTYRYDGDRWLLIQHQQTPI